MSPTPRKTWKQSPGKGRSGTSSTSSDDVDRLYGLPLEEFTAARNELAKELRGRGERQAVDDVRALRKPSAAGWAVNQLARREASGVRDLLKAGADLRDAQDRVLGGEGPQALSEAGRREREAVERLAQKARKLLGGSSDAVLEKVRETLHAAASDEELRGEIERGRVVRERRAAMFGGLDMGAGAAAAPRPPANRRGTAGDGSAKRATDAAEKAEREAAAAAEQARREQVAAARAELRALRASERQAGTRSASAERRLERAMAALERAQAGADEARAGAAQAREQAEDAARRAAEIERRIEELDGG